MYYFNKNVILGDNTSVKNNSLSVTCPSPSVNGLQFTADRSMALTLESVEDGRLQINVNANEVIMSKVYTLKQNVASGYHQGGSFPRRYELCRQLLSLATGVEISPLVYRHSITPKALEDLLGLVFKRRLKGRIKGLAKNISYKSISKAFNLVNYLEDLKIKAIIRGGTILEFYYKFFTIIRLLYNIASNTLIYLPYKSYNLKKVYTSSSLILKAKSLTKSFLLLLLRDYLVNYLTLEEILGLLFTFLIPKFLVYTISSIGKISNNRGKKRRKSKARGNKFKFSSSLVDLVGYKGIKIVNLENLLEIYYLKRLVEG
ncbi:hypothetical protein LZ32DRAFT_623295 [Colletotrichum eremochloae]|nr:hypothetical protein LZ32DRAFT_623295 [Colletotrichum eremochloae]